MGKEIGHALVSYKLGEDGKIVQRMIWEGNNITVIYSRFVDVFYFGFLQLVLSWRPAVWVV